MLRGDVVVEDGCQKGAQFSARGAEAVGCGADGSWVDFCGDEERDGVGTELVEEAGEEVHGLKFAEMGIGLVVCEVEAGDDEEDEIHEEADHLHPLSAVEFVVDEEGGEVVSAQGDAHVDEIVEPTRHDRFATMGDFTNEFRLKELVAVEENVVCEPAARCGNHAGPEIRERHLQAVDVVTCDFLLLLRGLQLLACRSHLVCPVVYEPKSSYSGDGEADAISPLRGDFAVRIIPAAVMEDK